MSLIELEFLSESTETREMCLMYWELDEDGDFKNTVSQVAKQYGRTTYEVPKKIKKYCIAYATTISCPECDTPYIYENRSDFQKTQRYISLKCPDCIEIARLNEESEKISAVQENLTNREEYPFTIKSLTFTQAIYLLSIVRYQVSEDLEYLKPYTSNQTDLLSPRHEYDIEIYRTLANQNITIVSPKTDLETISIEEEGGFSYRLDTALWEINFNKEEYSTAAVFLEALEHELSSMEWEESWYDDAKKLCKAIALQESLAYLDSVMSSHQFNFVAGEKTELVLNKVLEKHSVSQLYNLIWSCAKDAAAYYMRSNIPKNQAANSVVGGIERKYERYITNGWEIKPFKRNFNLPASIISQVLYGTTLHTDDGGFHKPLNEII